MKYICELCGLIYDEAQGLPRKGIAPGTCFEALPDNFECPGCYSERQAFYRLPQTRTVRAGSQPAESVDPPIMAHTDVKGESER